MATLTIKNIPDKLCKRLKENAVRNHRSLNGEVIASLEVALATPRVDPEKFLAEVRALRERNKRIWVTDEDLRAAKNWGRR